MYAARFGIGSLMYFASGSCSLVPRSQLALAVVASGLFLGWRAPQILTSRTRLNLYVFWEMMVFLLNGLAFVLIGLQLPRILHTLSGHSIRQLVWHGALISCAAIVVRIAWVFTSTYRLGVVDDGLATMEERTARLKANEAAVAYLGEVDSQFPADIAERLRAEYDDRIRQLEVCASPGGDCSDGLFAPSYQRLQQDALDVERRTIIQLRDELT